MEITTLTLGAYQTNCYILSGDGKTALVIDPGYAPQTIFSALESKGLTLAAILLTHGHFDHVGAVSALVAETDCAVYLCEKELSLPPMMTAGPLTYTHTYGEGDEITLAGLSFTVWHTPGHTPGSVCLKFGDRLFTGDTLFAGSCGRTDFPGSSPAQMRASLARLAAVEEDLTLYPGHGSRSTLSAEKRTNPFF
jgi:glyoxylase-like metal-dependent hydrolase (beta-lactamase superfamily II)